MALIRISVVRKWGLKLSQSSKSQSRWENILCANNAMQIQKPVLLFPRIKYSQRHKNFAKVQDELFLSIPWKIIKRISFLIPSKACKDEFHRKKTTILKFTMHQVELFRTDTKRKSGIKSLPPRHFFVGGKNCLTRGKERKRNNKNS